MAFNTTIGGATANSYVSVASADSYFNNYYQNDAWDEISSAASSTTTARTEKEGLLIQASRELDNTYRFFGSKYNTGSYGDDTYQALDFPRSGNVATGNVLFIPLNVKEAVYQQAIWVKLRRNKRVDNTDTITNLSLIANESYNFIKGYVNRQVQTVGSSPWQGYNY